MEASDSQMAVVEHIEQVMEETYKEMVELQSDLVDINKKLLPPRPVAETSQGEKRATPSGWFEEMLHKLIFLRQRIKVTRLEEAQRLKRVVTAGKVITADTALKPGKF